MKKGEKERGKEEAKEMRGREKGGASLEEVAEGEQGGGEGGGGEARAASGPSPALGFQANTNESVTGSGVRAPGEAGLAAA